MCTFVRHMFTACGNICPYLIFNEIIAQAIIVMYPVIDVFKHPSDRHISVEN